MIKVSRGQGSLVVLVGEGFLRIGHARVDFRVKQDASAPNGDNLRLARDKRALRLGSTKGLNVRTGHGGSIKELGELNQFMEHHLDEKQDEVRLRSRGSTIF